LNQLQCNPESPSAECQNAVASYCCKNGACTQDYGCKQVFFEAGGMCPFNCGTTGIYKCPFNDPYVCGQFALPTGSCYDTTTSSATGLPVFSANCTATLQDHCCGDTNMTCPLTDMGCKTAFFLSGATCLSEDYDYKNCHNGFYDYGPCNGFLPTAPFCNNQMCIDNPYSIGCATGAILPYCCGSSKDTCSLDPQCRHLVFPMFNAPGTSMADLKTTMVGYGPASFQMSNQYPCRWQCTWANSTKSPTMAPGTPTKAPTTKSPTKAPKKSSASGVSVLVSIVALAISCLL